MSIVSWLLVACSTVVTLLGFAGTARRLLDLRFGFWRTLLARTVAFMLAGPAFSALGQQAEPEGGGVRNGFC